VELMVFGEGIPTEGVDGWSRTSLDRPTHHARRWSGGRFTLMCAKNYQIWL